MKEGRITQLNPLTPSVRIERSVEIGVWLVILIVLIWLQLSPQPIIDPTTAYLIAGGIIAYALFHYYITWKLFHPEERRFLKDLTDIIFIGIIILVAREYGAYLFALFFLPIAAAAFTLGILHALVIALSASIFVAAEIFLTGQGYLNQAQLLVSGTQIIIFFVITLFTRFLALQIRSEREEKERIKARAAELAHDLAEERKLEAMEREFTNLTSHQLLSPISIIRGFASILKEEPGPMSKKQREAVEEIYENTRRMIKLIDDLRLESRISQHRYPISVRSEKLNEFLTNIIREFNPRAKNKKIKLVSKIPKNTISARLDPEATRQIIWNLLDNALLYTPSGGSATISLLKTPGKAVIQVADTGVGIPPNEQNKIFSRFYRASNVLGLYREGTGMGLAIAKELAERQDETLEFTSESKKGTIFTLTIPTGIRDGK